MSLVNINNTQDPNFRYKILHIEINQTGSSNNQKGSLTYLTNIEKISKQINHNPKTLTKYLGICLGSKINEEKYWIQGHHSKEKIQKYIFDFINCYVLCPKCSVPELEYSFEKIKKNEIIKIHCVGCGSDNNIDTIILSKNNKKIYDKIIKDIKEDFFSTKEKTSTLTFDDNSNSDDDFF